MSHQRARATWVPIIPEGVTEPLSNDLRKFQSRFSTLASSHSVSPVTWILSILPVSLFFLFVSVPPLSVRRDKRTQPLRFTSPLLFSAPLLEFSSFSLRRSLELVSLDGLTNDFRKTRKPVEPNKLSRESDTMLIRTASGSVPQPLRERDLAT